MPLQEAGRNAFTGARQRLLCEADHKRCHANLRPHITELRQHSVPEMRVPPCGRKTTPAADTRLADFGKFRERDHDADEHEQRGDHEVWSFHA